MLRKTEGANTLPYLLINTNIIIRIYYVLQSHTKSVLI